MSGGCRQLNETKAHVFVVVDDDEEDE